MTIGTLTHYGVKVLLKIEEKNMIFEKKENAAPICGEEILITDASSAVELLASARYETDCSAIILHKEQLDESFFRLSSGLAGEILQKFVNYQMRLAIVGDFSHYTSKPLKDFIYESNQGSHVGFWPTEEEALAWLRRS